MNKYGNILSKYMKDAASKGRYGDTELVHINKDEEQLLKNYRGLPDTPLPRNPETGYKEAFTPIQAVGAGLSLVSNIWGANKQKKAYEDAEDAAAKIKEQDFEMLRLRETAARRQAESVYQDVLTGTEHMEQGIVDTTSTGIETLTKEATDAAGHTGFAIHGNLQEKIDEGTGGILNKYRNEVGKLFDTRVSAFDKRTHAFRDAQLRREAGQQAAEEKYQNTLAGMDDGSGGLWSGVNQALSFLI